MTEPPLRVLVFREGRFWLAQGLERDVGVQGRHLPDLLRRPRFALAAELDQASFEGLEPAPPYFQALWAARVGSITPEPGHAPVVGDFGIVLGLVA